MSSEQPGANDWASPGQPPEPPVEPPPTAPASYPDSGWSPPPAAPPYGWTGSSAPYGWATPAAPKPGIIPLRPLGVGELLDGGFTTIRRYPGATLGLAAVVMLVVETVQILLQYSLLHGLTDSTLSDNGDLVARTNVLTGVELLLTLIVTAILSGMLASVVGDAALGRPVTAAAAWARTRPLFWRLLGVTAAIVGIEIAIAVACIVPGLIVLVAGSDTGGAALLVIGAIIAGCLLTWVWVTLLLATPAVVLEKQGIRSALSRSRLLVRGSWWRLFGIELLAGIIGGVVSGVLAVPFALAGGLGSILSGHPADQYTFIHLLLTGIGGFLAGTVVRPFSAAIVALLYLDRRMRAEALDLTLQQAASPRS